MEIDKMLKNSYSENTNSDIIENEITKIKKMSFNNKLVLDRLKKFVELLDRIDESINEKTLKHLTELSELDLKIKTNVEIFKTICKNLV